MTGKIWMFIFVIYMVLAFLGSTMDFQNTTGTWAGNTQVTTLSYISNFSNATQSVSVFGAIVLPMPNPSYFTAWFQVLTLHFHMFDGVGFSMFYTIVLLPFAILGIVSMVMLFIGMVRGNITWG